MLWLFRPLKLCFHEFAGQRLFCSKTPRLKEQEFQNSAGQRTKVPYLRGAKIEGKFATRSYGALVLCPVEFWTLLSLPRRVLEQCNFCPANSQRHIFRAQNNHKNNQKKLFCFFFKVICVSHCHFRHLYNQYNHLLRKFVFAGRYLKTK